ncbi:hypothetical protein BN1723_000974 [Verticillium longisporum]|uniref:MTHFR SAM-binding regulatory domain-containing protein n=1 Tax=Verticillium longisporum TaxID=100787 RepID=A0A0G4ND15_VERLO|nr:hypothetical protein BN1723_000974 [Verticillium longisporum]
MGSTSVDTVAQSSNATYNRPKTRQRVHKAPPVLDVPDIDEDAAERKRVLNVLAQRRYRERKREARTKSKDSKPRDDLSTVDGIRPASSSHPDGSASSVSPSDAPRTSVPPNDLLLTSDLDLDLEMPWDPVSLEPTSVSTLAETFPCVPFETIMWDSLSPPSSSSPAGSSSGFSSNLISNSTAISSSNRSNLGTPATSSPGEPFAPPVPVDDFTDRYLLPMADLTLLRAFLSIADRLGCASELWSPTSNSPFNKGGGTPAALLPPSFRPTPTQVQLPHHPMLDFLPWPSVRDRIISIFNMPEALRPPGARDALAPIQFAYDLEDEAEGVRIWGGDPYDATGWEIGQTFFERWWFIFDRDVVAQSNRLREIRGAARLHLRGPRSGNLKYNAPSDGPNAVTWGVFPGKEIVQPTIVEGISFVAWKDEAFRLGLDWAHCFEQSSPSRVLVELNNDFHQQREIFDLFEGLSVKEYDDIKPVAKDVAPDAVSAPTNGTTNGIAVPAA